MNHDIPKTLIPIAALCMVGAILGGGVKIAGSELPVIASPILRALLATPGIVFLLWAWRARPRTTTFLVRQATSSVSWAEGTLQKPVFRTQRRGGRLIPIEAVSYRRSDDGKTYVFTDRRGQPVRELPSYQVASIQRSDTMPRTQ